MTSAEISTLLSQYGVSPDDFIASGMESRVYRLDADTVLKVYHDTSLFERLDTLKTFYTSIDRGSVSFALPEILSVSHENRCVLTSETFVVGEPIQDCLLGHDTAKIDLALQHYLDTMMAVADVQFDYVFDSCGLYPVTSVANSDGADWNVFLSGYVQLKSAETRAFLSRDVADYDQKVGQLLDGLSEPYTGKYQLVHGDFAPCNVLQNACGAVTALIDFGFMTMWGDRLFDLATGWQFLDMYNELAVDVKARFLPMLLDRIEADKVGLLFRYILIYSILTANAYSPTCSDGHYQWCVANLNNHDFWAKAL